MNVRKGRSLLLDRTGRLLSPRVEAEGAAAWLDVARGAMLFCSSVSSGL